MRTVPIDISILAPWIDRRFDRSAGPGGQNVNKLSTRATLLFDFEQCDLLLPAERTRIRSRLARRLNADGRLRVVSQAGRTQLANIRAAELRMVELLETALHVAAQRRPTRPSRGATQRRLSEKKRAAETKRRRSGRDSASD